MELYAVIARTVAHELGIDWIYPLTTTNDHDEALNSFKEERSKIRESLMKDWSVADDSEDTFCVRNKNNPELCRYVKIVKLY